MMDGATVTATAKAAGSARGTTGRSTVVLSPTSSRTQKVYSVQSQTYFPAPTVRDEDPAGVVFLAARG
jgi:hypothetical protein